MGKSWLGGCSSYRLRAALTIISSSLIAPIPEVWGKALVSWHFLGSTVFPLLRRANNVWSCHSRYGCEDKISLSNFYCSGGIFIRPIHILRQLPNSFQVSKQALSHHSEIIDDSVPQSCSSCISFYYSFISTRFHLPVNVQFSFRSFRHSLHVMVNSILLYRSLSGFSRK